MWDMIRLELIANLTGAKCYFVLGGQKRKLHILFEHERFLEKTQDGRTRPVLRLQKGIKKASLRIATPIPTGGEIIKPRMQQYPNIEMPVLLEVIIQSIILKNVEKMTIKFMFGEILSLKKNNRFKPLKHINIISNHHGLIHVYAKKDSPAVLSVPRFT